MGISIVIPLYNKQDYITDTIQSILNQGLDDFEIVIVDDGSTDRSVAIIQEMNCQKIRLYSQENAGPGAARNKGVKLALYDWILFLDADDTLEPGCLQTISEYVRRFPKEVCFTGNTYYTVNDGKDKVLVSNRKTEGRVKNPFKEWFFKRLCPTAGNTLYRKEILLESPYNEFYRRLEDCDFIFNILRRYPLFYVPVPMFTYNKEFRDASKKRKNRDEDFLFHLDLKGKSFWERVCLYSLYLQAKNEYGVKGESLYKNYDKNYLLLLTVKYYRHLW